MRNNTKRLLFAGGILISILLLWHNRELLKQSPLKRMHTFEAVSEVCMGAHGNTYIIDRGKNRLTIMNPNQEVTRIIEGGSMEDAFYYACRVCDDSEGNIYIADIVYGDRGNQVRQERIIKLSGKERTIIFEADYTELENPPMQYGEILELQTYQEQVYFVKAEQGKIILHCIDAQGQVQILSETECPYFLSDASYDAATGNLVITTRQGDIYVYSETDLTWREADLKRHENMPWDVVARNGEVYYTDLLQKSIMHFTIGGEESPQTLYQQQKVLYRLDVSDDGKEITATDYDSFLYLHVGDTGKAVAEYCVAAKNQNRVKTAALWILCFFVAVSLITVIMVVCIRLFRKKKCRSSEIRVIPVVIAAITVSLTVSYSTLTQMMSEQSDMLIRNMSMFAELLRKEIDVEKLKTIKGSEDYHSDVYMQIKDSLDGPVDESYNREIYYYYLIYDTDGEYIRCLMDYEDTTPCGYPIYLYGDNDYTRALVENMEIVVADDISSYGEWVFILLPVCDSTGQVIAELEVGTGIDRLNAEKRRMLFDIVCTVFNSCAVVVMLILEVIFLVSFLERRAIIPEESRGITQRIPLRFIIFLTYMTDSMQDAFMIILCDRLYDGCLPIAREVAVALPMSMQLFLAAVFSLIGGALVEKIGVKRAMCMGFAAQMAGFGICLATSGYMGILAGKSWIGIGMGITYVTANTTASMEGSSALTEAAFADVAAGVLSGVTIGVGIGSLLLSVGSYKLVYLAGFAFLVPGLVTVLRAKNAIPKKRRRKRSVADVAGFLLSRRVLGFFLLVLVPFMIALSYREYFFPLYMESLGINEVQIGQIYLACGLLVIYPGPYLSKWLIQTVGAGKSILLASLAMAANMGSFVLFPNVVSVVAGVVILSLIISFAYTCQYTYFEQLPECGAFGEGNAMGIYSMFESLGQTLGPIVYGAVLMAGQRKGIAVLSVGMIGMLVLFALTSWKGENP